MLRVIFRVDASIQIGTGHVVRCLTLADSLRERQAECIFICRAHAGHLMAQIEERGYRVVPLPLNNYAASERKYSDWLGADWVTDAQETEIALGECVPDLLVIDHYAIDTKWEARLRACCKQIMVIDDLADRPHDCDFLLDQNLGRKHQDYETLLPNHCQLFVGPQYALLRPEFAQLRAESLARRLRQTGIKQLLISMGGIDAGNATGQVLQALRASTALPVDCKIIVVMGTHAPWLDAVKTQAAAMPWSTEVLINTNRMAELMAESDLAIGAAGSSSWERCCLGLPTIMMITAENQRSSAVALKTVGAVWLQTEGQELKEQLSSWLRILRSNFSHTQQMTLAASKVTSGLGAQMIANDLIQ